MQRGQTSATKRRCRRRGYRRTRGVANAILELSNQIIALHKLNRIVKGVTVNAGVIGGGTKANVVPDEAWVEVDTRAVDPEGAHAIDEAIKKLPQQVTIDRTTVEITSNVRFPPMAKSKAIAFMAQLAQESARELNFEVKDAATGGASDANMIAGVGIPVLDGLGPVGGLDHSPDKYIEAKSIVPRTALLAELIKKIFANQEKLNNYEDDSCPHAAS